MSGMIKISIKLSIICAVAALSLGAVNMITEPKIAAARLENLKNALEKLSPGGEIGKKIVVDSETVQSYYVIKKDGVISSYILNIKGIGYGGDLIILASYLTDGSLYKSVLMENDETPGLGKEAEKEEYMNKYTGFIGNEIPSTKSQLPQDDADAISGATITFSGIGKALVDGSAYVIQLRGE